MKNTRINAWFEHKLIIKASKFYYIYIWTCIDQSFIDHPTFLTSDSFFSLRLRKKKLFWEFFHYSCRYMSNSSRLRFAIYRDISPPTPLPPPPKKNPFNFLVSFLLWIWRLIFARSKPRLIVCIIYRRCRIFERKQPSGPRHWRWKETLFKHLTTKKQIPPFDSQLVFCVTLVPPVIDLS